MYINFFIEKGHGVDSDITTKILHTLMKQNSIEAFVRCAIAGLQSLEASWRECSSFID